MSEFEAEFELFRAPSPEKTVRFVLASSESAFPPPPGTGYKFDKTNSEFRASREAAGIWISGGSAWKIYSKTNTLKKVKKDIETAKKAGLPLVPIEIIDGQKEQVATGFVFQPVGSQTKSFGFAIKTQFLKDTFVFFSAQEDGVTKFKGFLAKITNKSYLERSVEQA